MKNLIDQKRKIFSSIDVIAMIENFNFDNHHFEFSYFISPDPDHPQTEEKKNVSYVIKKIVGLSIILIKKNEAMIRFKNTLDRKVDKKLFHYITEIEEVNPDQKNEEDDGLNDLNEIMKNFILDATSAASTFFKFESFETFFTSFEALQHAEVMTVNLNQRAFEHGLGISTEFLNAPHDFEASDPVGSPPSQGVWHIYADMPVRSCRLKVFRFF